VSRTEALVSHAPFVASRGNAAVCKSALEHVRASERGKVLDGMQSKKRWVLLVDDHDDSRELMSEFLSAGGFEIESCASGEQALERVQRDTPSAVITDLSLEGMSGTELAKRLRTNASTAEVPILAVTGHAGFEDPDKVFTEILVKPVALDKLTAALRRVVPT